MITDQGRALEVLVETVLRSTKYKHVSPDLIKSIGKRELEKRRSLKGAIKATKSKLHQVAGAYLGSGVDYNWGLGLLKAAGDEEAFRKTCRQLMDLHSSTSERLAILDEFYKIVLGSIPEIRSVMDVACGFNPLAWPWMSFGSDVEYWAYDIYVDMVGFIQSFMDIAGIKGKAEMRDVLSNPPTRTVDLALILKSLPCLEQVDKTAVSSVLDSLHAKYMIISYPVHSLGGRQKGMAQNYKEQFYSRTTGRAWQITEFEFSSELVFVVKTQG